MAKCDLLGDRMRKYYENTAHTYLTRREPVIIRLKERNVYNFRKKFGKPFDEALTELMENITKYLCGNIQGCVFGFTNLDEITLVITEANNERDCAWLGYNIQKMASQVASMATQAYYKFFVRDYDILKELFKDEETLRMYLMSYEKGALFTTRVFNIPTNEICNYLIWRQQCSINKVVQLYGESSISTKILDKRSPIEVIKILFTSGHYNNKPSSCYWRGSCCYKMNTSNGRLKWGIDNSTPLFSENRDYINRWV